MKTLHILIALPLLLRAVAFAADEPSRLNQDVQDSGPYQAMGTRAGEVTDSTAIVWTRLTAARQRVAGEPYTPKPKKKDTASAREASSLAVPVDQLEGACAGAPGRLQLRYGTREDLSDAVATEVATASADNDFICQFKLSGLLPGTVRTLITTRRATTWVTG